MKPSLTTMGRGSCTKIMTSTAGCSYSFVCSKWWVWLTPETCRVNLQNNRLLCVASRLTIINSCHISMSPHLVSQNKFQVQYVHTIELHHKLCSRSWDTGSGPFMAICDVQIVIGQYVQTSKCPIKVVQIYFVLNIYVVNYIHRGQASLTTFEGGSCIKNMTSTGGCSYSFVYSWWWVWLTPETCTVNLQSNK